MCGIAGFCSKNGFHDMENTLVNMINIINHRGPDDDGIKVYEAKDHFIGFGHKRLSILDLSPSGRQPMESIDERYSIVFNGEIYNYSNLRDNLIKEGFSFRSSCDTEVILNMYQKYGTDCLNYFNGMFAFVIYDREKNILFGARDRLGIRPFYYYKKNDLFIFSSEVKSLLKFPNVEKSVNNSLLFEYVQNKYISNPDTLFSNINKLEPGHYFILDNFELKIDQYWDINDFKKYDDYNVNELVDMLSDLMDDSIRLRMISDVPFGAFLSGGIDSSLIVALMAKHSTLPVKTFSVGFNEENHSELPYARTVSKLYNTDHHELIINYKDYVDNIYNAVWHRDAPVSETSDIPIFLLAKEAKKSVSVILTGEGSDEIFAGYPKYSFDHYSKFISTVNNKLFSKAVNSLPYKYRKVKKAYNTMCIRDEYERFLNWFAAVDKSYVNQIFTDEFKNEYEYTVERKCEIKGKANLDRMLYFDMKYWLTDDLLERGDKMLMAFSIEGRFPFLDYNVVEFAYKLQDEYRINGKSQKYIVKELSKRYLPEDIINRKKVGFYIPIGDWFKNDLKNMVEDHLLSSRFLNRGIFKKSEIEKMIHLHSNSIQNNEKEIWMLLNLEIWFRTFIDKPI